jgi:hypothetical protein
MLAPARSRCRFVDCGYVSLWDGLMVAVEEKQSSLIRCVAGWRWGRGDVKALRRGGSGKGEAFGVPQRGTAYQPGVKPRVWRTTGAF